MMQFSDQFAQRFCGRNELRFCHHFIDGPGWRRCREENHPLALNQGMLYPGARPPRAEGLDQRHVATDRAQPRGEVTASRKRHPRTQRSDRTLAPARWPGREVAPEGVVSDGVVPTGLYLEAAEEPPRPWLFMARFSPQASPHAPSAFPCGPCS